MVNISVKQGMIFHGSVQCMYTLQHSGKSSTSLVNYEEHFYLIVKQFNGKDGSHYFGSKETDLQVLCVPDSF